ncbi:MAG: 4-alpha-glucanotransferase [Desulfobulbaceae bacterium]|nr:4-alpha-glucanotransferase [Desulfobulbaceae bacterium]
MPGRMMQINFAALQPKIQAALEILGIRNFLLGIHDASFPGLPEEDLGRGTPYSRGAEEFFNFVGSLGFNGIQLGPQGITTSVNPSPYDGTFFSKNPLSLAPLRLTGEPWNLVDPEMLAAVVKARQFQDDRVHESFARMAVGKISTGLFQRYQARLRQKKIAAPVESFDAYRQRNAGWLDRDALYEILRQEYGGKNWKQWQEGKNARLDRHLFNPPPGCAVAAQRRVNGLFSRHREAVEDYSFTQYLLARQHDECRNRCRQIGLKLFGDFQIGLSGRDAWRVQSFLLRDYVMGAPPSRTNPEGQPWNYPVLDPRQYCFRDIDGVRHPGPAVRFLRERADKMFAEFDGLRIDHPHGLVCPWVYRANRENPVREVQQGARLFASPAVVEHPELAEFAIVRPDQLNRQAQRHEDNWVLDLDPEQVRRYALLLDVIMDSARDSSRGAHEIACEILSTQPYPIKRVMEIYSLGRFRVTQKADLGDPHDVYRSENAQPEDWLMLGNHDTPPVWQKAEEWIESGVSRQQARYLAARMRIPEDERTGWAERIALDAGPLVQAKFADLFIGPARNIMVFFTDLLGIRQAYNKPGTVIDDNWSLRVDPGYRADYISKLAGGQALNIPKALAMALRAKSRTSAQQNRELIAELENFSPDRQSR